MLSIPQTDCKLVDVVYGQAFSSHDNYPEIAYENCWQKYESMISK